MKKFIYVHIFRTGGTTLKRNLEERYENIFLVDTTFRDERKEGILKVEKNNNIFEPFDYFRYKIIMGHFTYKKYQHLNRPLATLLRDPLDRFISNFSGNFVGRKYGFEEFCQMTSNIYTHFIGDLNNFDFIGLTEYYKESMKIIGDMFGYDLEPRALEVDGSVQHNQCTNKRSLTKEQIEYFKSLNKEDYELFNYVLKRFRDENIIIES
jgi:hypothetical protein